MKLLMENWQKYLTEQEEGKGILLYHATCSPPESFVSGIDPTRAKGYGQGEGFYFWTNKKLATKHAVNHLLQGKSKEEKADCSGGAYIIVSDEPVTPETFDIDYEAYYEGLIDFVTSNEGLFPLNQWVPGPDRSQGGIKRRDNGIIFRAYVDGEQISEAVRFDAGEISPLKASGISKVMRYISTVDSSLFKRFEEYVLPKADAIKYNDEKTIFPLRIEDLEGNVVWSR
jgi:hypothetical protein